MVSYRKYIILFVLGLFLIGCGGQKPTSDFIEIRGLTMGTMYMVKIAISGDSKTTGVDKAALTAEIENLLKKVNQQMSTWIKDSEISRFNRYDGSDWFDVSADTAAVMAEALRIGRLSNGAFDITMGPLINLWGFGPGKQERRVPEDRQIAEVMERIGFQKLSVRLSPSSLKKESADVSCNFSGIAKGFGVDKTAEYLDSKGFVNYLVEIGGEIRARGVKSGGLPWKVAIAAPDGSSNYHKALLLKNVSMATSGDYHNYFEKDGVRYSHTVDPVTGRPITHTLASVTVIHDSCMTADALATAINVLGPVKGFDLAVKENLPVFLIIKKKGGFMEKMTPQFEKMLLEE
jgi:thiamine biosynthesis lipoprotein